MPEAPVIMKFSRTKPQSESYFKNGSVLYYTIFEKIYQMTQEKIEISEEFFEVFYPILNTDTKWKIAAHVTFVLLLFIEHDS